MQHAAAAFLHLDLQAPRRLEGGEEALVLRAESADGPRVIHVSPPWRTREELAWIHGVIRHAASRVPQAVAPLERDGETTFDAGGRMAAVYPFVQGEMLDRDDPRARADAAEVLAAIHLALLDWHGPPRPPSGPGQPAPAPMPAELEDPALDAWWASARDGSGPDLGPIGPTHGDYYRGNLLCAGGRIAGVIDWHDASVRPLAMELASATFEMGRDDDHVLRMDRAEDFVRRYLAAGGPVPGGAVAALIPLIRRWLRIDVRMSLAYGAGVDGDYVQGQMRAFRALAGPSHQPMI